MFHSSANKCENQMVISVSEIILKPITFGLDYFEVHQAKSELPGLKTFYTVTDLIKEK